MPQQIHPYKSVQYSVPDKSYWMQPGRFCVLPLWIEAWYRHRTSNGGFSDHTPWLGVNPNYKEINAADQMADDSSVFRFYQKLISLRKEHPVMAHGDLQLCCPEDGPVIAYTRSYQDETWLAVHNFSQDMQKFQYTGTGLQLDTSVLLSNYPEHDICPEDEILTLKPYETVIFRLS